VLQQVAHQAAGKLQDVLQRHLHLVRACEGSKAGVVGSMLTKGKRTATQASKPAQGKAGSTVVLINRKI
jgi:hypothetical protein